MIEQLKSPRHVLDRLAALVRCAVRRWAPDIPTPTPGSRSARGQSPSAECTSHRLRVSSFPTLATPAWCGVPMIGPSPSMPMMPSTVARCGRTVAAMSRIDGIDPDMVQHVLGPAVDDAAHHLEEVFERQGYSRNDGALFSSVRRSGRPLLSVAGRSQLGEATSLRIDWERIGHRRD